MRWLNDLSIQFLQQDYLLEGQTVEERIDIICKEAEKILNIEGFAEKFKENIVKGWYSLSTPVWTNFGTDRGLPISCFNSHISDSMESILSTLSEIGVMTKHGGGTSAFFGNIRPRGAEIRNNGQSSGSVHFMKLFDNLVGIISQGSTRRGNFAAYLPIDHEDIEEFLNIKNEGSPIQDISFGVCVYDYWMEEMVCGDAEKRRIWAKVLECRSKTGYPYISFMDNINNGRPDVYKEKELIVKSQNLCAEICLPSTEDESFVCDLSSMNLLYYNEWKNTDAVELLIYFLDAVMSEFIEKAQNVKFMERAVKFATNHRALGLGVLGWHSLLQSRLISFESMQAKNLNVEIFKLLKEKTYKASKELITKYGKSEPEVCKGFGRRNSTLMAIAPTKSSAFILGQVSEGIEPHRTNYYIKDLAKGKFTIKNVHLEKLLEEKGKNTEKTWNSILKNGGSVEHLSCLTNGEKAVFKTFAEISQKEVIIQAAQRQKYVDQGQSLNLMIHPSVPIKDVNALIIEAWRLGVKSLYYQMSVNAAQQFSRNILSCSNCES